MKFQAPPALLFERQTKHWPETTHTGGSHCARPDKAMRQIALARSLVFFLSLILVGLSFVPPIFGSPARPWGSAASSSPPRIYLYAHANPVMNVDPSGKMDFSISSLLTADVIRKTIIVGVTATVAQTLRALHNNFAGDEPT